MIDPNNKNENNLEATNNEVLVNNVSESDSLIKRVYSDISSDNIIVESIFSRPVDKINIPEPSNLKLEFLYNYFERDEKVNEPNDNINLTFSSDADNLFYSTHENPRCVKISFDLLTDTELDLNAQNYSQIYDTSNFIFEGSKINKFYTGLTLKDTGSEKRIYKLLKSNLFFKDIKDPKDSQKQSAQKLFDTLSEKGGLFGEDKQLLVNYMNNIGREGYSYGSTVGKEVSRFSSDPLSGQFVGLQINKLLIQDLLMSSNRITDNVFGDELRYVESLSGNIKDSLLKSRNFNPNTYSENDYELTIDAIDSLLIDEDVTFDESNNYQTTVKIAGFLIEKFEIKPDGSKELKYERVIANPLSKYGLDTKVRYGGVYQYRVRTVAIVKAVARIESDDGFGDQIGYSTFFVASKPVSKTINTVETEHPEPPGSLSIKFDYDQGIPLIRWSFPLNKKRDIKKFEVFKRLSINEPFVLIGHINFDDSLVPTIDSIIPAASVLTMSKKPILYFYDKTFKEGQKPIYAVGCVDAHGLESNYSAQIMVEHDRATNRVKRRIVSRSNAPKPYPNLYLENDSFQDAIKVSGYSRFKLFFTPEYYKVKQTREDTSGNIEQKDLKFLMVNQGIDTQRYHFHFINVDNQKSDSLRVGIKDMVKPGTSDQNSYDTNVSNIPIGR